jgi:hypothetical protein
MLFIRCDGGVSHHADEAVGVADVSVGVRAMSAFIDRLAEQRGEFAPEEQA